MPHRAGWRKYWVSAALRDIFPNLGVAPPSHIVSAAYHSLVQADAPYAYYRLDEADAAVAIADSSGNARTGTGNAFQSSASSGVTDPPVKSSNHNGATNNRHVDCGFKNASLRSAVTIECWVNQAVRTNARAVGLNDGNTANIGMSLGTQNTSGTLYWEATINGTYRSYGGTTTISASAWHYLVVTFDGNLVKLYVDGSLDNTSAAFGPAVSIVNVAGVGNYDIGRARSDSAANQWNGQTDEVAFYDYALSQAQITAHWGARL